MKTETRKVYFCEHCRKHNLSAGSISRHEKYCPSNPENKHKCFAMCKHLLRKVVVKQGRNYAETEFHCTKRGIEMYSFILEKKMSIWPYPCSFKPDELTRMPLKCALYEQMSYDEQEARFYKEEPQFD